MNEQYIQSVVKTVEKIKDFLLVFVGIRKTLVKPENSLTSFLPRKRGGKEEEVT